MSVGSVEVQAASGWYKVLEGRGLDAAHLEGAGVGLQADVRKGGASGIRGVVGRSGAAVGLGVGPLEG